MTKPNRIQRTQEKKRKEEKESDSIRATRTTDKENAEKPLKIDDTPLNVARSIFGIRSDKFKRP
jgi:hypothetical protein